MEHAPRLCKFFHRAGGCRHGAACRFVHDASTNTFSTNSTQSGSFVWPGAQTHSDKLASRVTATSATTSEALLREWHYPIPPKSAMNRKPLGWAKLSKFCEQGLRLISSDVGQVQEVISLIAGESGMLRVAELIGQDFASMPERQLKLTFSSQLLPFFQILTHSSVSGSPILHTKLMTIYNFMFGFGGNIGLALFDAVTRCLSSFDLNCKSESSNDIAKVATAFNASFIAFAKMVEVNSTALITQSLAPIVERMQGLLDTAQQNKCAVDFQQSSRSLTRVKQRLSLGAEIPRLGTGSTNAHSSHSVAKFRLSQDMPGQLSDDGARHDNDHSDIIQISIFPTVAEIQNNRIEYLPSADQSEWHKPGLPGLLDRHFRLLREDTVGQLRDATRFELDRLRNPDQVKKREAQSARTFVYSQVTVELIEVLGTEGLKMVLAFNQPKEVQRLTPKQRSDWWTGSKRLGSEALVCLLSSSGVITYLVVAQPSFRKPDAVNGNSKQPLHQRYDLFSDNERAYVITRLANHEDASRLMENIMLVWDAQYSLVEFPGILLPAFQPVLQALQQMSRSLDVPFSDILAPYNGLQEAVDIPIPAYASRREFSFDMSVITPGKTLRLNPHEEFDLQALEDATTLDHAQAGALVASLKKSFALVQGPPGTGKSYTGVSLIRVLVANKKAAALGPIFCVCYTNHALDQLLEHLLDNGISQIVRVGSGSKSERLKNCNLRELSSKTSKTKIESREHWAAITRAKSDATEVNRLLTEMTRSGSADQIRDHLFGSAHFDELFATVDEEGFIKVGSDSNHTLRMWINGHFPVPYDQPRMTEMLEEIPLYQMSNRERRKIYMHWVQQIRVDLTDKLDTAIASYQAALDQIAIIRSEMELRVLREANIIGITTSGLARKLSHLRQVESKVLVCEEAGEVLESHTLAALLPKIEHCILIGDHLQLRPTCANYDLSVESHRGSQYALDVSLFERLVAPLNGNGPRYPFCSLGVQRRMHPSISELISSTLYPRLANHPSVKDCPPIVGMKKRLFWMHHERIEDKDATGHSTSHTNAFEVDLVASLVRHLVRQGAYQGGEVAVLTPYLGQLRKLRTKLSNTLEIVLGEKDQQDLDTEDIANQAVEITAVSSPRHPITKGSLSQAVRIATVDNFQGEEAKCIVVSLVRSNKENKCGFLRTSNRINVLLSRAQHGMYIIGNAHTAESVDMWAQVINILKRNGNFGNALELQCERHLNTGISVSHPDDFMRLAPEGGCSEPCTKQLACGHACVQKCHSEMLHQSVFCQKSCSRPKSGCTHNCLRLCGEKCPKYCEVMVSGHDLRLDCGHFTDSLPCYQHQDPTLIQCRKLVQKTVSSCGHVVSVPCYRDVDVSGYRCKQRCGSNLGCGHDCLRECHSCRSYDENVLIVKEDHGACQQICRRKFNTCSHSCKATCHSREDECPLCEERCEVQCSHSKCPKKCYEPCVPCAEGHCASACEHSSCTMPCAAPCNRLACGRRCSKILACGHQCPSVCGEACPNESSCQMCCSQEIKDQEADMIMMASYQDIDLDEDPCIFLRCGHVLTMTSLDGIMSIGEHFELDDNGNAISLKPEAESYGSDKLPVCPKCRGSLRDVARYGRLVRRALLDESAKKYTAWANVEHNRLAETLEEIHDELVDSQETAGKPSQSLVLNGRIQDQLIEIVKATYGGRYRKIRRTRNEIRVLVEKLAKEEQPYTRVRDLIETARRQNNNAGVQEFSILNSEINLREHLLGRMLLLRCDVVLMSDVITLHQRSPPADASKELRVDFSLNREECEALMLEAMGSYNIRQVVESQVFWARYVAMECSVLSLSTTATADDDIMTAMEALKIAALEHLDQAKSICEKHPQPTDGLEKEVADVRRMVLSTTYASDMKMVYMAMQKDFRGTGHWYRCTNGHLFTVGECGLPMQLASCPACGSQIGGQHHQTTEGVSHARDFEARFGSMTI